LHNEFRFWRVSEVSLGCFSKKDLAILFVTTANWNEIEIESVLLSVREGEGNLVQIKCNLKYDFDLIFLMANRFAALSFRLSLALDPACRCGKREHPLSAIPGHTIIIVYELS
jgi:hypothetical protein